MSIYQHFRPEEKDFIDQVLSWKEQVEVNYAPKLSDFLDPREQEIVRQILGKNSDVKWKLNGGPLEAERKRVFLYPEYYQCEEDDFQISLFEIEYPKKFLKLEHPQILGSLMSLGLKRGKFGDIFFEDDLIQFVVSSEVEDYIHLQLTSIGRATIRLNKLSMDQVIQPDEKWQDQVETVSSLRLDVVISAIYNISRQKSQLFIQQGIVKVNWTMIENPSFECKEGDIISVRGHGRSKINTIDGKTKKEKWKITASRQK